MMSAFDETGQQHAAYKLIVIDSNYHGTPLRVVSRYDLVGH